MMQVARWRKPGLMKLADRRAMLALLVAGAFFMENLDATVITPAIPALARSFGALPIDLNVGISAYMMALGVFIPISGWTAERFGARRIFAFAIALFTFASLMCATSTSLGQFVATRVVQGAGGALMVPVGRLVVLRETPKERLIQTIAVLTWPALLAPVLGPPLGGWIVEHSDWRWIFWLNLPLGMLAFLLALRLVPDTNRSRDKPFDWSGFVLIGSAIACLMFAAENVHRLSSDSSETSLALAVGIGMFAAGVRHLRRARHAIFDLDALDLPTFRVTVLGGALFCMSVSAVPFLIPVLFQIGFGFDSLSAGMILMAVFAGNLVMKPMTTAIIARFGFRPILIANGIINAAMIAACALFSAASPLWIVVTVLFVGGMARSMQFTALNTIAFSDVSEDCMANANTIFSTVLQLSMGFGVALGALAWRIGETLIQPVADTTTPFRIAFLVIATVALLAVADSMMLQPGAGDHVSRRRIPPNPEKPQPLSQAEPSRLLIKRHHGEPSGKNQTQASDAQ